MSYLVVIKAFEALENKDLIEKMVSYKSRVKRSGCPKENEE